MKKIIVSCVLAALVLFIIVVPVKADTETDIFDTLKKQGFTESYVAIDGDSLLIRVGFDALPENTVDLLFHIALLGYKADPSAKKVYVEFYQNDEPIIGIFVRGKDLGFYTKGALSEKDLGERAVFFDLRSPEGELSQDYLNNYNALIDNINLNDNNLLSVDLEYFGDSEKVSDVIVPMLFSAVNSYAGADAVALKFRENNGEKWLIIQAKTDDILSLVNGDISPEDFAKKTNIYERPINQNNFGLNVLNVFVNKIKNLFGVKSNNMSINKLTVGSTKGSKKSNPLINVILAVLSFVLFIIFWISGKNAKKKIAHILQARKVNLAHFPENKKRVYGKFVGVIHSESPLIAPFSKKQVVMYQARLDRLDSESDADGEGTHSIWNTVWKENRAADFAIKQNGSDSELSIDHTKQLPTISLSATFNKSVNENDFPIVQQYQAKVFKKRFRAIEKALEVGRKVFFVGGIERVEDGNLHFIPRPGYLNSIFLHSERKLTSHYLKVSHFLYFLAFVFFVIMLYFGYLLLFS
jgi:hypothetical protein